jgi:hypothetical protein
MDGFDLSAPWLRQRKNLRTDRCEGSTISREQPRALFGRKFHLASAGN